MSPKLTHDADVERLRQYHVSMAVRTSMWLSTAMALACAPDPCERLARGFCEHGVIDCDTARVVFREAEVPAATCERGLEGLGALGLAPPDMHHALLLAVFEDVMKDSPRLAGGSIDALRGRAEPAAEPSPALPCPEGTAPQETGPAEHEERWCARPDGTRHGPAKYRNRERELVRTLLFADGEIVAARYHLPANGQLDPEIFVCPAGVERRDRQDGARRTLSCEPARKPRIAVVWQHGEVVGVEDPIDPRLAGL